MRFSNLEEVYIPDVTSYLQFSDVKCSSLNLSSFPDIILTIDTNDKSSTRLHIPPKVYLKDYAFDSSYEYP